MAIDATSTLVDVCFTVCTALSESDITAVLCGGSAATFYAPQAYQSKDADFVITVRGETSKLNDILNVVGELKVSNPDKPISAEVIAYQLRLNSVGPYDLDAEDIVKLFQGLRVLVPSLCLVVNRDIYLGTSPKKFKEAVLQQISVIPPEFRFALDQIAPPAK